MPHRSFQFRAPCGASGFLRKQHPLGNVITEWFSTCAARWYLCNSSSRGAEREGVGKPQRVQVAWQMLDWQRLGMAGHASWNILATTVIVGLEVRQLLGITLTRNQYRLQRKSQVARQMLDWQRRGMAGHASWNILVTTVILDPKVRQLLIFTSMRTYYKESHRCCGKYLSLDWQRQGMIGHSSGNMFVTTVVMGSEVRQPWWVTWKRSIQTSIMNTKQATEDSQSVANRQR